MADEFIPVVIRSGPPWQGTGDNNELNVRMAKVERFVVNFKFSREIMNDTRAFELIKGSIAYDIKCKIQRDGYEPVEPVVLQQKKHWDPDRAKMEMQTGMHSWFAIVRCVKTEE